MRRCYIVTRQLFYMSGGTHYQIAEDNPVRDVFTTEKVAIDWAKSYIEHVCANSHGELHMREDRPDSECIYKAGAFDKNGVCNRSYSVIKQGMRTW